MKIEILSSDYYNASVGYGTSVTSIIKKIVRKSIRQDTSEDALDAKKDRLSKYETSEEEALRIGVVLEAEGRSSNRHPSDTNSNINGPTGIIAKMNAMMDRDPEVSRRNSISRLRDEIKTGDSDVARGRNEVILMKAEVLENLGKFQSLKEQDAKLFWKTYARGMVDYYGKTRDTWSLSHGGEALN